MKITPPHPHLLDVITSYSPPPDPEVGHISVLAGPPGTGVLRPRPLRPGGPAEAQPWPYGPGR
eukprot:763681-Hanusia_phi.AAC.1